MAATMKCIEWNDLLWESELVVSGEKTGESALRSQGIHGEHQLSSRPSGAKTTEEK